MLRRVGGMQLGVACGTLAGALILCAPAGAWAGISLGVLLVIYSAWTLFGRPFSVPAHADRWLGPLAAALTGFVTAPTGVFVVPAAPPLQSPVLALDQQIQPVGLAFTGSTVSLYAAVWRNHHYSL